MRDISSKMTLKDEKVQLFSSPRIPSPKSYSKPRKRSPEHKHSFPFTLFTKKPMADKQAQPTSPSPRLFTHSVLSLPMQWNCSTKTLSSPLNQYGTFPSSPQAADALSAPTRPSEPSLSSDKDETSLLVPAGHTQTDAERWKEMEPTWKGQHGKGLGLFKRCANKERRIWIPTV